MEAVFPVCWLFSFSGFKFPVSGFKLQVSAFRFYLEDFSVNFQMVADKFIEWTKSGIFAPVSSPSGLLY
jgi:hypothetical protein